MYCCKFVILNEGIALKECWINDRQLHYNAMTRSFPTFKCYAANPFKMQNKRLTMILSPIQKAPFSPHRMR